MSSFNNQAKVIQDSKIWDIYRLPFTTLIGQIYAHSFKLVADELSDDDAELDKIVEILNEHWYSHKGTNPDFQKDKRFRVRGWGQISYMKNPEEIQDAIGGRISSILNTYLGVKR